MTESLRKSIDTLRGLAPRLHEATDQAALMVQRVERFLNDDCKLTLSAWVPIDVDPESPAVQSLGYALLDGRCRVAIRDHAADHDPLGIEPDGRIYPWSDAPHGDRLRAFRHLPALLSELSELARCSIQSAAETSDTVGEFLDASMPSPVAPPVAKPAAVAAKPQAAKAPKVVAAKPQAPKPIAPKPQVAKPEAPKPSAPKPQADKVIGPKPVTTKPVDDKAVPPKATYGKPPPQCRFYANDIDTKPLRII
jgi:hypothetical protein